MNIPSRRPDVAILILLLAIGLTFFVVARYTAPTTLTDSSQNPATSSLNSGLRNVVLIQRAPWHTVLLGGLAMAIITVSVFELLRLTAEWLTFRRRQKPFEALFGQSGAQDAQTGIIILQADKINVVMERFVKDLDAAIHDKPDNRLYKARTWINKHDADGARRIREAFHEMKFDAPEIVATERRTLDAALQTHKNAPFIISMGLGFTDHTTTLVERFFNDWLKIVKDTPDGDALEVRDSLFQHDVGGIDFSHKVTYDDKTFYRLLPKLWDITGWVKGEAVDDYAMILRHTSVVEGHKRINIMLAGFTEHGTYAAGDYLASNWLTLHNTFIKGKLHKTGNGDFLFLIHGKSPYDPQFRWTPLERLRDITPERLEEVHLTWSSGQ